MRIAWFSSIRNDLFLRSAIYSREILGRLPAEWDVELFIGDQDWTKLGEENSGEKRRFFGARQATAFHYLRFSERQAEQPFDSIVFQLEDHSACRFVQRSLHLWPGICFFHDINLNKLHLSRFEHSTAGFDINEFYSSQFGSSTPAIGDWRIRGWSTEVFDSLYVCGRSEIDSSIVVSVTNPGFCSVINKEFPNKEVLCASSCLPRGEHIDEVRKTRLRQQIGLDKDNFVIAFSGSDLLGDRIEMVLRGFGEVLSKSENNFQNMKLLWCVDEERKRTQARGAVEKFIPKYAGQVALLVPNSSAYFLELVGVVDVFVALRNSAMRGLPFAAENAIALGVPTIVADTVQTGFLPEQAVCKVRLGADEEQVFTAALSRIINDEDYRVTLRENGIQFGRESFNGERAIREFVEIIERNANILNSALEERVRLYDESKRDLIRSSGIESIDYNFLGINSPR